MDNLDKKIEQLIEQLQELKKTQTNFATTEEEICKSLPNGQWTLEKVKKPQQQPLVYPKTPQQRIKDKAVEEFKNRMKDIISFYHNKQQPIPSRLILLDEGMPFKHPALTNKERLNIFQNVARDVGLDPNYPIHHDHKPHIDEHEFGLPKGQRVTVTVPKHDNVKLSIIPKSAQNKISDLHRQGYGGYLLPKPRQSALETKLDEKPVNEAVLPKKNIK